MQAAADFRHKVAEIAIFLVYIGASLNSLTFEYRNRTQWPCSFVLLSICIPGYIPAKSLPAFKWIPVSLIELVSHNSLTDLPTELVQQGISEKVALATSALASFVTGFALAYSGSWRLALALSPALPCLGIERSYQREPG